MTTPPCAREEDFEVNATGLLLSGEAVSTFRKVYPSLFRAQHTRIFDMQAFSHHVLHADLW